MKLVIKKRDKFIERYRRLIAITTPAGVTLLFAAKANNKIILAYALLNTLILILHYYRIYFERGEENVRTRKSNTRRA